MDDLDARLGRLEIATESTRAVLWEERERLGKRIDQLESTYKDGIKRLKDRWEERLDNLIEGHNTLQQEQENLKTANYHRVVADQDLKTQLSGRLDNLAEGHNNFSMSVQKDIQLINDALTDNMVKRGELSKRLDRIEGGTQQAEEPRRPTVYELREIQKCSGTTPVRDVMVHYIQSVLDRYIPVYEYESDAVKRLIDLRKILSDDLEYYKGNDND
jgi:putative component of toxin-antitoxin plasmid stabilization module